jgi:indolepyruvate ferredoxin oxidoreductase beta subunit
MIPTPRPLAVLVGALGGQGGGVLAEWLVETAWRAGYVAQGTSIPGVAQRTGATTYYVEVCPVPVAQLDGRRPVLGLHPVPGNVDLVIATELLEAVRIVQGGMVSPDRTTLVTSTARALTTIERMAPGDGRLDSAHLAGVARAQSQRLVAFDMDAAAREAGTIVSAVMLGAIAASGVLPMARAHYEDVIRESGVGGEASLRGFARGHAATEHADEPKVTSAAQRASNRAGTGANAATVAATAIARDAGTDVAADADIVALGAARLVDFQDAAYADLYSERLERVRAAERAADPTARQHGALTRETARYLALWMAFDDVVRVAALKSRASRFARVHRELGARPGDVVRIIDHFKPGVPELAGLLPSALGARLAAWERRRRARGREPLAMALKIRTDSVSGFLLLRMLAGLRRWRRHGLRYKQEQAAIERWLDAVIAGARCDWRLGYELAQCGRLIKGYGATNERGKDNLAHILSHLAAGPGAYAERADAIRQAREAALSDDAGKALDDALVRHGAPARPVPAKPILWQRSPKHRAARHAHEH